MGREVKSGGLEVIRSMSPSISISEEEYLDLGDLEGSTIHPNQVFLALGRNVQLEDSIGIMFDHGGART